MKVKSKNLVLFALLFSSITAYSQCETYLQKADNFAAQGDCANAKKWYEAYKVCNPSAKGIDAKIAACNPTLIGQQKQYEISWQKAEILLKQAKYGQAKKEYLTCKSIFPNNASVDLKIAECDNGICENHKKEGYVFFRQGNYRQAKEEYLQYQSCNPDATGVKAQIMDCDNRMATQAQREQAQRAAEAQRAAVEAERQRRQQAAETQRAIEKTQRAIGKLIRQKR
jgi:tetratricopeptide (TPR) repeat protein